MAIMLSVAIASQTFNLNVFAQDVQAQQSVSGEDAAESNEVNGWDGVTTQDVYEGEGYQVTFTLTGHWEGGYNANVRIENTGTEDIENWYLDFEYPGAITNIWNAEIFSHEGKSYIVKNAGWNLEINMSSIMHRIIAIFCLDRRFLLDLMEMPETVK